MTIAAALAELAGGGVAVLAPEDPRAPCALVAAGERMSARAANTMATHGHSLLSVCLPLAAYERLGLPPVDPDRAALRPFAALQSIEASGRGVTTGISAADRAATIRAAAAADARPGSLRRPGHVLIAPVRDGGVLAARRLREAASDLALLVRSTPAAVICPLLDAAGDAVPAAGAAAAAERLGFPLVDVGQVLVERLRSGLQAHAIREDTLATASGRFRLIAYEDSWRGAAAVALAGTGPRHAGAGLASCRVCSLGGAGCGCQDRLETLMDTAAHTGGAVLRLARPSAAPLTPCADRTTDEAEQAYAARLAELVADDLGLAIAA
ncbi:MAG: 3,4-dihydroxy 2-butanone 4-phosphate synthase / cyclohydrolase [Solirubrobacteraceae bacterium]|nr:3,4-dihydroxy 2-butanone 4-phosphate synthase / cyclohydrolase [Solirubrobacteraceae bacterium]